MRKNCYLCIHSVEVSYTIKEWSEKVKKKALFCTASPPTTGNSFRFNKIITNKNKLYRYKKYPIMEINIAVCSFYELTSSKKKINRHSQIVREAKRQATIAKKKLAEAKAKKIAAQQCAKEKAAKAKKEKERATKRKEYQRKYREGKRAEKLAAIEVAEDYSRFEILGIEE